MYTSGRGSEALPESHDVKQAVSNVKRRLRMESGTILWSDNSQLWTHNVQVSSTHLKDKKKK